MDVIVHVYRYSSPSQVTLVYWEYCVIEYVHFIFNSTVFEVL